MKQSDKIQSINPFTKELLFESNFQTTLDIKTILETSEKAYHNYRNSTIVQRQEKLKKLAILLSESKINLATMVTKEMGKPIVQSLLEVEKSIKLCNYYINHLEEFLSPKRIKSESGKNVEVQYRPQGAVLGIMPWNFPVWQVIRFAIPIIAGGNVVLLKPALNVPLTSILIEKLIAQAYESNGIFSLLLVWHDSIKKIFKHNHCIGLSVTGSNKTGKKLASMAGKHLIKSVLELGGNDPFLVFKSAQIEKAAQLGSKARLNNNGQTCIAAKRFILHKSIAHEFLHHFRNNFMSAKIGDPLDMKTEISVLAKPIFSYKLANQVEKSLKMGANYILKGGIDSNLEERYLPEIIENIPVKSPAFHDELFGPVASIFIFNSEKEMIECANQSPFGLGASIWSNDMDEINSHLSQLNFGSIAINDMLSSDPGIPFGGTKKSGYGREMGVQGFEEFLNCQSLFYHE